MTDKRQIKRQTALAATIALVLGVWLVLLPAWAARPAMKQHLQWLEENDIDPSATYYTELEVMQKILARRRGGVSGVE